MHAGKLHTLWFSLTLGLLGCGDDGGGTTAGTASASGTDSASATATATAGTDSGTASASAGTDSGSASGTDSATATASGTGGSGTDSASASASATGSTSDTASGTAGTSGTAGSSGTAGTGGTSGTGGSGTSAGSGSTGGVSATGSSTSGGSTGGVTATTGAATTGAFPCDKVDFLFVIDNSLSMEDEQANLIASFPGFINGIEQNLPVGTDYQIGITSTDTYSATSFPCNVDGALITQTTTQNCGPFASGSTYMTMADNLVNKFTCAADIGINGSGNERPMDTMRAALAPGLNMAGGCNEGFLRDDALLVVIIVSDEEDDHEVMACNWPAQTGSADDPIDWFNDLVAIKGLENRAVILSLVGPTGAQACPPLDKCGAAIIGAEEATRIVEFTNMFTYGIVGQVCAANYDPFFDQAVGIIQTACELLPQ